MRNLIQQVGLTNIKRKKLIIESNAAGALAELTIRLQFAMTALNHIISNPATLDHDASNIRA
jgi:hypothetical protein